MSLTACGPTQLCASDADTNVPFSEVLAGLSYALDLTEGQRPGHSVRSCLIGMRIAEAIGLPAADRSALFYALLMKDLGCSSNAARFASLFGSNDHDLKMDLQSINWSRALESFNFVLRNVAPGQFWLKRAWRLFAVLSRGPQGAREVVVTRCERGAEIARLLALPSGTVHAIRALDEHWDGNGQPYNLKGHDIPLLARILCLAQTVEVFFSSHGVLTAFDTAAARRGTWFDPDLVDALFSIGSDAAFWRDLATGDSFSRISCFDPSGTLRLASEDELDAVADAFALVVDAKSPWTYQHSRGVADAAVAMGAQLDFSEAELRAIRRAGLLHDLGKLGVSNLILDKPAKLTDSEFDIMRSHPGHTMQILNRVSCFRDLAAMAAAHHERLDGRGYHLGLSGDSISRFSRVLCVADIFDALHSSRPYRAGLEPDRILDIMKRDVGTALDPDVYAALRIIVSSYRKPAEIPAARIVFELSEDYQQAA